MLIDNLTQKQRELFNQKLNDFPNVYSDISEELRTKKYLTELSYRTVILLEDIIEKPIKSILE